MKILGRFGALSLILGLAACGGVETPSRDTPLDPGVIAPGYVERAQAFDVTQVIVQVPTDLSVSERNGYYPTADIVWRGDAPGDRYAQIEALFDEAAERVLPQIDGDVPAIAVIRIVRFHGVTERTRFSVGGVYNMEFTVSYQDGDGNILEETRFVEANLPAPGGQAALELERAGQTERVRVVDYLSYVLLNEFGGNTVPGAPEPFDL